MYKSMKTLISRKFYKTSKIAQKKLDVFFSCDRLTDDEYEELASLITSVYNEPTEN